MSNTRGIMDFIIKINFFKYKRFKDGWCRYRIIILSHLTVFRAVLSKTDDFNFSRGSRGGARGAWGPPLFLDQTEARWAEKNFFRDRPPSLYGLNDWSPPFSEGLDPPLNLFYYLTF